MVVIAISWVLMYIVRTVPDLTISNMTRYICRNSNPVGSGQDLGRTRFSDHRTIRLMKLMASIMLSAAVKRQYISVLPLSLCQFLTKFVELQ